MSTLGHKGTRVAARWLLLVAVAATPVQVWAQPQKTESEEASARFKAGVDFYKAKDFPAALVEFKRAYQLAPHYRVLYNLGQTSRELNDYASALSAFEQYLAEGGKGIDAARRTQVQAYLDELSKKVGRVMVTTNVSGAEVLVDDVPMGQTPLSNPLLVNAGRRKLTATLSEHTPSSRVVDVAGGDESTVKLELVKLKADQDAPPPPPPPPPPPASAEIPLHAWIMLAGTGAGLVATGIMGGLAISARGELDDALATVPGDAAAIENAQSKTQSFAIGTDVAGGITIAAAVTTAVLFGIALTASPDEGKKADAPEAALLVTPTGAVLSGRF